MDGDIATLFNEIVGLNDEMTTEVKRLSKVVGKEGKINQRGRIKGARGGWEQAIQSVNELIEDMVQPTAEVARVIGAVAKGDLSQSMTVEIDGRPLRGEFLRIGKVVNTMVEQLGLLRIGSDPSGARSGHRRKAGRPGQGAGRRRHLEGPYRQREPDGGEPHRPGPKHRDVTTAVAKGDLSKKITVEVKGEVLELKNTSQHHGHQLKLLRIGIGPRVAREVGTEENWARRRRCRESPEPGRTYDNVNLMATTYRPGRATSPR
jgi:HAMP domain-containing protein